MSDTGPFPEPPDTPGTAAEEQTDPPGADRDVVASPAAEAPRRRSTVGIWIGLVALVVILGVAALALTAPDPEPAAAASPSTAGSPSAGVDTGVTIDGPALAAPVPDGQLIPEWSAPTLDGGTFMWSERPDGPTVLAVWAPWCPHCQAELPRLAAAADEHPGVSLVTLATAVDPTSGPTPQEYMDSEGLSFLVALDDDVSSVAAGLGVQGFPTTYFVDADGRVIVSASGELDPAALDEVLTFLEQQGA